MPLILLAVGIIYSCAWLFIAAGESLVSAIVTGTVQGGIIASVAVFGNQVFKQYTKSE